MTSRLAPSLRWPSYLPLARLILGLLALVTDLTESAPVLSTLISACFATFSVAVVLREARRGFAMLPSAGGLLALFLDTVFFLALAAYGIQSSGWLSTAFFFYLVCAVVALYSPKEVAIVTAICVLFLWAIRQLHTEKLRFAVLFGGLSGLVFSVTKHALEKRIRDLEGKSEDSRTSAEQAREAERQRIGDDFHDGVLQSFISFQMRLDILRRLLERDYGAGLEELKQVQELSTAQLTELRSFVRSMRPMDLAGGNMTASVRRLVEDFEKETGIPVTFVGGETLLGAPPESSAEILQMIREALHNVRKHARASRVAVTLEKSGKTLMISIDDNGVGFRFSGAFTLEELDLLRLGPASIRRRARSLSADLLLESRPGRGAGLKMKVPL